MGSGHRCTGEWPFRGCWGDCIPTASVATRPGLVQKTGSLLPSAVSGSVPAVASKEAGELLVRGRGRRPHTTAILVVSCRAGSPRGLRQHRSPQWWGLSDLSGLSTRAGAWQGTCVPACQGHRAGASLSPPLPHLPGLVCVLTMEGLKSRLSQSSSTRLFPPPGLGKELRPLCIPQTSPLPEATESFSG